ncbi:MAG TPA: DUF748 domain-containing protein, partial [Chloroflexota bacterium]|nr:DUF748 domain-containing protein [Chloroflexota bacterium]
MRKQARVVEEVVVSKDVQEQTETVRDTVRRTEVEVEPTGAAPAREVRGVEGYDADFRSHYTTSLAGRGHPYERWARATATATSSPAIRATPAVSGRRLSRRPGATGRPATSRARGTSSRTPSATPGRKCGGGGKPARQGPSTGGASGHSLRQEDRTMCRCWKGILGVVAGLIVGVGAVSLPPGSSSRMGGVVALGLFDGLLDAPLRGYVERQINRRLQGYTVRIGTLDVHPFSASVDLHEVAVVQDAHPDPPVVHVPQLHASVQWRALLRARVVADVQVERPALHLNLTQLVHEARDEVPVQERGWQEAVQAVSPLHINEVRIVDGEVTYVDQDWSRPMHLRQLHVRAGNIHNIQSAAGVYPSDLRADGVILVSGRFTLEGQADFLAVPHLAVKAQVALEQLALAPLQPVARRYHLDLRRGTLSAAGDLEYAPTVRRVHLRQLTLDRLQADYLHEGAAVDVHNFSNQLTEGTAAAKVTGRFMGSGRTVVGASFRPETNGPDF